MGCPRSRDGSIKSLPVAEARVTASVFDLSSVDVCDGGYVEKKRLSHLLAKLVQGLAMAGCDSLIGRFRVHTPDQ